MFPPNKPKLEGLIIQKNKRNILGCKQLEDGTARDWFNGIDEMVLENTKSARLFIKNKYGGVDRYICYLCGGSSPLSGTGIARDKEHIRDWSRIKKQLISDCENKNKDQLIVEYSWIESSEYGFEELFLENQVDEGEGSVRVIPSRLLGALYCNDLDNLIFAHGQGCNSQKGNRLVADLRYMADMNATLGCWKAGITRKNVQSVSDIQEFIDETQNNRKMLEYARKDATELMEYEYYVLGRRIAREWEHGGATTVRVVNGSASKGAQSAAIARAGATKRHREHLRTSSEPPPNLEDRPIRPENTFKRSAHAVRDNPDEPASKRRHVGQDNKYQEQKQNQTDGRLARMAESGHLHPDHS